MGLLRRIGAQPAESPEGGLGFDVRPSRPLPVTIILVASASVAAAAFAHFFKEFAQLMLEWYGDSRDATASAASLPRLVVFVVVTGSVILAAALGRYAQRNWSQHVGVEAVAASARGEGRSISLRATMVQSLATWTVFSGMVSIGRESAIIETGGAVGAVLGRKSGGRGDALAVAGIAAAFAAAYHAPIAAVFYVEETLRVRASRRAVTFGVAGAAVGYATSIWLLGGGTIFPPLQGSQWKMIELALIGLVPAVLVAHGFLYVRARVRGGALVRRLGRRAWIGVVALAAVAGVAVAYFPLAAGNGMDALRQASVGATVTLALALTVGKLIGTTAALGAGAPGGVLTPTISITSGTVLLILLAAESFGLGLQHPWDAMVAAMAVGVAVGLRSPFVAVFLLPEMLGDYSLVPAIALIVALAMVVDRGVDRLVERFGRTVPERVFDEDA